MDLGLLTTGIFAIVAFGWGKGKWQGRGTWLRRLLLLSWVLVTLEVIAGAYMATLVLTMATIDISIAGAALTISTHDSMRYDARAVGLISMALMPAHWIMSATHGALDWTLYASLCNAGFVLQCLIVRGWLDDVGRSTGGFFARLRVVRMHRDGGQ